MTICMSRKHFLRYHMLCNAKRREFDFLPFFRDIIFLDGYLQWLLDCFYPATFKIITIV